MRISKKIVLLGHFGVGKTSLIQRFVKNSFSNDYKVSIGVHISKKVVEIADGINVSLLIWDLEGTNDMSLLRDSYLGNTHGLIYVFDITRPSTFQNIDEDLSIIADKMPGVPRLIVANKSDLVITGELEALFENKDISYDFLASAKTGEKVNDLFLQLTKLIIPDVTKL